MPQKTPLFDCHRKAHALMVDFAGWQMPLHYGSQIEEHHAVRKNAGVFDVSHMGIIEIEGPDAVVFLRYVLANDVAKLKNYRALYSCLLNERGGIIDDLIVYQFSPDYFRLVVNAACREKDFAWLKKNSASFHIDIHWRNDCLLALQGPNAISLLKNVLNETTIDAVQQLQSFQFLFLREKNIVIAHTGYTGESGVEMMLPPDTAIQMWEKLMSVSTQPCGLGARDTLRLEAGLNLYGTDMDENTSPLIANLAWTVSFQDTSRHFMGRDALVQERQNGVTQKFVGLKLETRGVLRNHQIVRIDGIGLGTITSGTFSPTLNCAIALARIPTCDATTATVERRGEWLPVKIVSTRFIGERHE